MFLKGIFILDIEVELAWGIIDERINREKMRNASEKVRVYLDNIINLLDEYKIPVTWGILGHLILNNCECVSGMPHPEMPRPSYRWLKRDWYGNDPCKKLTEEPAFYGKDIIDKIMKFALKTKISHDIAYHSFSHQLFGDPGCTKAVAEAEIKRCRDLLWKNYKVKSKVFIFPRDYPGHLRLLQRNSFIAFRGRIPRIIDYPESGGGVLGMIRKYSYMAGYFASFFLAIPPPVVSPVVKDGLINIPGSLCYNKKTFIPLRLIVQKVLRGIRRAVNEKRIFHLYTHLINFGGAPDSKALLEGFEEILAYANACRQRGDLEILSMRQIAETFLQRLNT